MAATATALGAGGLAARWWNRVPGEGLEALSDDEYAFVQALGEAWMPPGGEPPLSGADANVGGYLDAMLAHVRDDEVVGLKLLMQALDDLPVPRRGRAFRHLPLATRQAVLEGWQHHPSDLFRLGMAALMVLISMGWTTHPDVAAGLQSLFGCGYGR